MHRDKINPSSQSPSSTETRVEGEHIPGQNLSAGYATVVATLPALTACGGGSGSASISGSQPPATSAPAPTPTPASTTNRVFTAADAAAARFLLHAGFEVSASAIEAIKADGKERWLAQTMMQANDQTARDFFKKNGLDQVDFSREFQSNRLTDRMIWNQLMKGGNPVRKRMALALSNFFVISVNNLNIVWPAHAAGEFWDLLNLHAFGNFRELLEDVAYSPAMSAFLDTIGNRKADPRTGRSPDENFARELMQLFTIGLTELNDDGTQRLQGGQPVETYTNADVEGLAKVFTGFNLDATGLSYVADPSNGRPIPDVSIVQRRITADPTKWQVPERESQHSIEQKKFLGLAIPAGTGPDDSVKMALDFLFAHNSLPPFFCKQMIQRLVTSNPSAAYIRRVVNVFKDDGRGVRGNLAAVFKAILLDPEASSESTINDFRFGKLREPVVRFVQFGRQFGLATGDGTGITRDISNSDLDLGQVPFRAPSVFNFFQSSYAKPQSATSNEGLVGPEFQMAQENGVAAYINFMAGNISGNTHWLNDWSPDFSALQDIAHSVDELVSYLNLRLTGGQLRDATIQSIRSAISDLAIREGSEKEDRLNRSKLAVLLVIISNDYLVQK